MNFIFDIDGTIAFSGKPVAEKVSDIIHEISNAHNVVFASARPVRDILAMLPKRLHGSIMLGCNGGMAWKANEFLFTHTFPDEDIKFILSLLKKHHIPYLLDGIWNYSLSNIYHSFHDYIKSLSNHEQPEETILSSGVTKILILDGKFQKEMQNFLNNHKIKHSFNYHRHDDLFDITPQLENKYLSLCALGLDFKETIAFGNDANDFAMLENAKISVFVGPEEIFAKATYYSSIDNIEHLIRSIFQNLYYE